MTAEGLGSSDIVFVVGCPRSGTTWVQLLLAEHPDVVTAPETQIFAYYLSGFLEQWRQEHHNASPDSQGKAGLSQLLSQEEFDELCRMTAGRVLERIAGKDSEAGTVVEKSPKHALYVEWIHSLFPEAHFVHVVRDPRDTVSSILAAGRSWGGGWAPRHALDAARMWCKNVSRARRGAQLTSRYLEVQYENLKGDTVEEVSRLYRNLGLKAGDELCADAVEACRMDRLRNETDRSGRPLPGSDTPDEFFRKGKAGGWREDLSRSQVRMVEFACGDLMETLGYQIEGRPTRGTTVRVRLHDGIQRVRESIDWQLERLLRWL